MGSIIEAAIPPSVRRFAGRITDVDSHEMVPAQRWVEEFGDIVSELAEGFMAYPNVSNVPDFKEDDVAVTAESVWRVKGSRAPGASETRRRLDVMDATGVTRQLLFPTGLPIFGSFLCFYPVEYGFMPNFKGDRKEYGRKLLAASNEWLVRAAKISDRIRPVAPVYGDTVAELIGNARGLINSGIRTVWLFSSILPGGVSPAHESLDPFWQLLTDHNVVATLHVAGDGNFLSTQKWADAAAFEGFKVNVEFNMSPWHTSVFHLAAQNFLATVVTGGVFERHPKLRFGVIECGSYWLGPLASMLDMWHRNNQTFGINKVIRLPLLPSEYIQRNVRISSFDFEHVDEYIDRHGLGDCYCYASDYPHYEGGKDPMGRFAARLERLGDSVMERFFVTNGQFLLPD